MKDNQSPSLSLPQSASTAMLFWGNIFFFVLFCFFESYKLQISQHHNSYSDLIPTLLLSQTSKTVITMSMLGKKGISCGGLFCIFDAKCFLTWKICSLTFWRGLMSWPGWLAIGWICNEKKEWIQNNIWVFNSTWQRKQNTMWKYILIERKKRYDNAWDSQTFSVFSQWNSISHYCNKMFFKTE